jgi:hypothetical protein
VGPWIILATYYFGSPIPHTIAVKSVSNPLILDVGLIGQYFLTWWRSVAPFHEFWAVASTPVSDYLLIGVVLTLASLAVLGSVRGICINKRMTVVVLLLWGFVCYRTLFRLNPYFMWYLPPFMALCVLMASVGIGWLGDRQQGIAIVISVTLAAFYATPLLFTMKIDRDVQAGIEDAVRTKMAESLNARMRDRDTVVLEPLGYPGWFARNKTIYDFPGLGSKIALEVYKRYHHMPGLIKDLKPSFVVARPDEVNEILTRLPDFAVMYGLVETFDARPDLSLTHWGTSYYKVDSHFELYQRRNVDVSNN